MRMGTAEQYVRVMNTIASASEYCADSWKPDSASFVRSSASFCKPTPPTQQPRQPLLPVTHGQPRWRGHTSSKLDSASSWCFTRSSSCFLALRAPRNAATTVLEKAVTTTVEMTFGTHVVYLCPPRHQMHAVSCMFEQRNAAQLRTSAPGLSTGIRTCTTARTRS